MNRSIVRRITVLMLIFSSLLLNCGVTKAAVNVPEKVRVGLYYAGTSQSQFSISAQKGIQVGYVKDGSFVVMYEEAANNSIFIRKDAYYTKNGTSFTECNPSAGTANANKTVGPFHIQLNGTYPDYSSANTQAMAAKQKGIDAYPVFSDTWQVWAGFYVDQNSAQSDIPNLQQKLGAGNYKVIQPSSTRIAVYNAKGETILLFDSATAVLQLHPKKENSPYIFTINGKKSYRGDLEVRRLSGSDMTLINILPLEHYVYGVVPNEIEPYSKPEALKAQAVTARTYALNNINEGKHKKYCFDLCTTTNCQVYGGYNTETAATNKAVDDTKGLKITYNGRLAYVFFYASSGGKTEDVRNVWGSNIPYLVSVDDNYELTTSSHYNWQDVLSADEIKSIMLNYGYDLGDIVSMEVTKRSDSGRVTELVINGTKGQKVYTLEKTRTVFGLNSQMYSISTDADVLVAGAGTTRKSATLGATSVMTANGIKKIPAVNSSVTVMGADGQTKVVPAAPTKYTFTGKGWGHGVGMSQEGAKGMANAGFKFDQILLHYFPGTKIE